MNSLGINVTPGRIGPYLLLETGTDLLKEYEKTYTSQFVVPDDFAIVKNSALRSITNCCIVFVTPL